MANSGAKTTLKSVMLRYRNVGGTDANGNAIAQGNFTDLSGVLRGLTITQDEPESTSIDAEFYDSPFYIEYTGNPVTINFEWANYSLVELQALLGGTHTDAVDEDTENEISAVDEEFLAPTSITSIEKEWELEFKVGFKKLIIYKGALVATLKKDEDGALNYACTITSLNHNAGTSTNPNYKIYSIKGVNESSGE